MATLAALLMLAIAVVHGISHFTPLPHDMALGHLLGAMDAYRFGQPRGQGPSLYDVFRVFSFSMVVLLAGLSLTTLSALAATGRDAAIVRPLAFPNLLTCLALVAGCVAHREGPPTVAFTIVSASWLVAFVLGGAPRGRRPPPESGPRAAPAVRAADAPAEEPAPGPPAAEALGETEDAP